MYRLLLAAVLMMGGSASAQMVLKLGTVDAQTSHSGVGAEAFAAEVAKLSGGTIKVEEFLAGLIDETKIISAPYVFRSLDHAQAYLKSDLFKPGLDKLRGLGAIVLDTDWTWMQKDPRGLIAVRPIRTPKDLEGMKLRIWESKTAIETWRGLGANTI